MRRDNAEHLADEAEKLLGRRPAVFEDLGQMAAAVRGLQAVDITADAAAHHSVAVAAFDLGLHVLCEKPLGLTVRACNRILAAQQRSGKLLSVAENYRRDPMSRLTRALLDAGAIGAPQLFMDISAGSGNTIVITPWRHKKDSGGMLLDGGVHNADMMLYYLGDIREVYARVALWEKTRYKPKGEGGVSGFYERWQGEMPESIEATAEDTVTAVHQLQKRRDGPVDAELRRPRPRLRPQGDLRQPGLADPRRDAQRRLARAQATTAGDEISGAPLLDLVPDFRLDAITARLFGADRLASYNVPFPAADRKLLAIEFHELGECILNGTTARSGWSGRPPGGGHVLRRLRIERAQPARHAGRGRGRAGRVV